jgi:hypothetical protein
LNVALKLKESQKKIYDKHRRWKLQYCWDGILE